MRRLSIFIEHVNLTISVFSITNLAIRYGKTVKRRDKLTNNSGNPNPGREITVPQIGANNFQRIKQTPSRPNSSNGDQKTQTFSANNFSSPRANYQEAQPKRQVFQNNNVTLDNLSDNERPWIEHRQQRLGEQPGQSSSLIKHFSVPDSNNCSVSNRQNTLDNSSYKKTVVSGFEVDNGNLTTPSQLSPTIAVGSRGILANQQEQDFDSVLGRSNEFSGGITCSNNETHLRQQSQNLRDNVPTNEAHRDLPMNGLSIGVKLKPTYTNQITSQNRAVDSEANALAAISNIASDVGTESLKQVESSQSASSDLANLSDANYMPKDALTGPVNHLNELYQFEQEYFYQVSGLDEKISTGSTSDIGSSDESRSRARTNDNPIQIQEANVIKEHNGVDRNSAVDEQTSVLAKQSTSNVNNNSHNTIYPNNTGDSLLKQLSHEDDSYRRLSNEVGKEETCQGYGNNQHETDDRLKQLSLRFSADANKKSPIDNDDRTSLLASCGAQSRTSSCLERNTQKASIGSDRSQIDAASSSSDADEVRASDIYSFDLDTVAMKEDNVLTAENLQRGPPSPNPVPEVGSNLISSNVTDIAGENIEPSIDDSEPLICLNENELNDLIEKISSAHRDTCSFLKTKTVEICKRQSISSLPTIAGSQYCRYRQSPPITTNKQRSDNSPTSSLLNGSAGSSASSVSSASSSGGGSPMNSSQYITSPPTLSPSSNSSTTGVASTSSRNNRMASYIDVTNHHHEHAQQSQQHITTPINNELKLSSNVVDGKQTQSSGELSNSSLTTIGTLEEYKITLWQEYALLINPSIKQVVEFAKQVPGFLALNQLDQLLLIKSGFFEIWLVTIAGMFNCADNTLTFSDGTYIDRQQLDTMFDKNFSTIAFNFSISFNQLCLDDTEIGLVSAIILLQPSK